MCIISLSVLCLIRHSFGTWALPASERKHLEEMERVNALISDIENAVHLRETVKFLKNRTLSASFA